MMIEIIGELGEAIGYGVQHLRCGLRPALPRWLKSLAQRSDDPFNYYYYVVDWLEDSFTPILPL